MIKHKPALRTWVLYGIIAVFIVIFIYYLGTTRLFIDNSLQNLKKIAAAAVRPHIDSTVLHNILVGYQNTFLFSAVGLSIGIYLGLFLSYFSTRFRRFKIGKVIGIFFRSAHEVVFIYILMLIFGLNPYIAVFAIGISFGGIIGKIFTDNMNLTENNAFYAYRNRGYNYRKNFFFHLFPKTFNSNLNYVIYRFECAIRSSIVLSYVGLPGIGFYLNNALNDGDFNSLFTYVYSLILFVLFFSILTSWLLRKMQYNVKTFLKWFLPASLLLCAVFTAVYYQSFLKLFHAKNLKGLVNFGQAVLNIMNPKNTAFYNIGNMSRFLKYTGQTTALGVLGSVFLLILFFVSMLHYFYGYQKNSKFHIKLNNAFSIVNRSVPEVVFLTFLLFVMKPSVVTGALALALHNFGILTKLIRDRIESNYADIFLAYKNRRYKSATILFFIFIPLLGRDLVSLVSYRFEMMIKSSAVIGILGSGGLGYLLRLEMSKFNYEAIIFVVLIYVALFLLLDKINMIVSHVNTK